MNAFASMERSQKYLDANAKFDHNARVVENQKEILLGFLNFIENKKDMEITRKELLCLSNIIGK